MHLFYKTIIVFTFTILSFSNSVFSQSGVEFTLKMLTDSSGWGVYVKPTIGLTPSDNVILISGQVSLVVPANYFSSGIPGIQTRLGGGDWVQNAKVLSPPENPNFDYFDFGYASNTFPTDGLKAGFETLLFTFSKVGNCPEELHLMDNETDPFSRENSTFGSPGSNSANNNPGQNFPFRDVSKNKAYEWVGNYSNNPDICSPISSPLLSNNNEIEESSLEIFPNPSSGLFNIKGNIHNLSGLAIFNTFGNKVFEEKKISTQIDLSRLPSGMYFLSLELETGGRITERIHISH